jgi:uncharacterized metal-binding protein YceD (DUF177 family)
MKINVMKVPEGGCHLSGNENAAILDLNDPDIKIETPVWYELDVLVQENTLSATGQLGCDARMVCVSCLRELEYPLRVDNFAVQVELSGSTVVDLTEAIREDILLVLPAHPRCDWDGKTACPGLRPSTRTDSDEVAPDPWAALNELNLKNKR